MPPPSVPGQPASVAWFATTAGRCLLDSEAASVHAALAGRPGQAWLWLAPFVGDPDPGAEPDGHRPGGHGLRLQPHPPGWRGDVQCALPLPLAIESVATVVLQHVLHGGRADASMLAECARVLVPGGCLLLYALNPLSPYRWHWKGHGLRASEPMPWRRRLRQAGLQPDPVSQGIGPRWTQAVDASPQHGPGLRAAWVLRAEKRSIPLTGLRQRKPLRIGGGVPVS